MSNLFNNIYKNKTVLVTGHTGFKGSWLIYWLSQLGAKVIGYSLEAPTKPNHIELLSFEYISIIGDVRDQKKLDSTFKNYKPDIVFHLAAQPLVRFSYKDPIYTYETNVIGTLKVLESCKKFDVKAIVNVTSDKSYENKELDIGYKENDALGGYDPYSSSKSCADLLANSYRNSYFNSAQYTKSHNTLLASCRAGNVIGGGDWAKDRLISDLMISASEQKKARIRNPKATRPWQHVLEPLSGYLQIGQKLLEKQLKYAEAWNFGPSENECITVDEVAKYAKKHWKSLNYEFVTETKKMHEANLLKLDCSKANTILNWNCVWNRNKTFEKTINWYKAFYEDQKVLTGIDLDEYIKDAKTKKLSWTS